MRYERRIIYMTPEGVFEGDTRSFPHHTHDCSNSDALK